MKRCFSYIVTFLVTFFSANVFAENGSFDPVAILPGEYFPTFSCDNQVSLLTSVKEGKDSCAKGPFGKDICVEVFEKDYLQYKTSQVARLTIKKYKRKSDGVEFIAVVNSVQTPIEDSKIQFLDCNNQNNKPLTIRLMEPIGLMDFVDKDSMAAKGWTEDYVRNKMDMLFLSYKMTPGSNDIVVTLNNKEYLAKEDYEKLRSVLKSESLTLSWNGDSFDKK